MCIKIIMGLNYLSISCIREALTGFPPPSASHTASKIRGKAVEYDFENVLSGASEVNPGCSDVIHSKKRFLHDESRRRLKGTAFKSSRLGPNFG